MAANPWREIAAATPGANGMVTYEFPSVSQGMAAQVSVAVPNSVAGVQWSVFISNQQVGSTEGSSPYGPINLSGGETLVVTGTPPAGNMPGPASLVGSLGDPASVFPTAPSSGGGIGQTLTLLGTITFGNTSVEVSPTPTATALYVTGQLTNGGVRSVQGNVSGIALPFYQVSAEYFVALLPGGSSDTAYTVTLIASAAETEYVWQTVQPAPVSVVANEVTVLSVQDTVNVAIVGASAVFTAAVSSPAAGADWAFTLAVVARLVGVFAELTTSATAATRGPLLLYEGQQFPMTTTGQTASKSMFYAGSPGFGTPWADTSTSRAPFPFSSVMLPIGATVQSSTVNIQATDQWSNIELLFSAA